MRFFGAEGLDSAAPGIKDGLPVMAFLLVIGIISRRFAALIIGPERIGSVSGLIFRRTILLDKSKTMLVTKSGILSKPLGFRRLIFRSGSASRAGKGVEYLLSLYDAKKLENDLSPAADARKYCPRFGLVLLFSFVFSSSLSGAAFTAAAVKHIGGFGFDTLRQTGKLLGSAALFYENGDSTLIAAVLALIAVSWTVSFAVNLSGFAHFHLCGSKNGFYIERGFLTRLRCFVPDESVRCVELRRNLMSSAFSVCSAEIFAAPGVNEKNLYIPFGKQSDISKALGIACRDFTAPAPAFRAARGSWLRYVLPPALSCAAVCLMFLLFPLPIPLNMKRFLFIAAMLPLLWLTALCAVELQVSGAGYKKDYFVFVCRNGLSLKTLYIRSERMAFISLRQSWLQKLSKTCDIIVKPVGGCKKQRRVKNITLADGLELMNAMRQKAREGK